MKAFLLFAALLPLVCVGQTTSAHHYKVNPKVVDPRAFKPEFHARVQSAEAPFPSGASYKKALQELKAEYAAQRVPTGQRSGAQRTTTDSLTVLDGFAVRFFLNDAVMQGGTPNDNTLAISNGGMLLASYNSQLWGYDLEADSFLFRQNSRHPSFSQFLNLYTDTTFNTSFPFDPKLHYDQVRDRFIFVFLSGNTPALSRAIVCFSSTNYPTDPWFAYELTGNPFNDNTWTDYPQIAINDHSFYLSLNQIHADSTSWITGFSETVVWQMDLDQAFAGDTATDTKLWRGFDYEGSELRYLHPVKTAIEPAADSMYFVSNRPFHESADTFFVTRLWGSAADTHTTTAVSAHLSSAPYGLPPDANQQNGHRFYTNDSRPLGAVRVGNEIQLVGNTVEFSTGLATIYHGLIENANQNDATTLTVFSTETDTSETEYGYPNIDFIGRNKGIRETVIFMNHSGTNVAAGTSAAFVNHQREFGATQCVKKGLTYVNMLPGNDERWGDYIGLQRRHNASSRAWAAGYYGFGAEKGGTWVSELAGPDDWPLGVSQARKINTPRLIPNPAAELTMLEFNAVASGKAEVYIVNASGARVAHLGQHPIAAGKNQLRFSTEPLAAGLYTVCVDGAATARTALVVP